MGLDTVELVYSFEQYFNLSIPDPVAEQLYTVADVAAYVSEQLGVAGLRHSAARELVRRQLSDLLELPAGAFEGSATVQQLLPNTAAVLQLRQRLASRYGTVAPELSFKPLAEWVKPSLFETLLGIQPRPPRQPWTTRPLAALVNWVVAASYEALLPRPPASAYEVEQAIMGITSNSSGLPVEEIELTSSFTNDLGMD